MSTMAIGGAKPAAKKTVRESIKFHLLLGLGIVVVLVVGLGGRASTVLLSGAQRSSCARTIMNVVSATFSYLGR